MDSVPASASRRFVDPVRGVEPVDVAVVSGVVVHVPGDADQVALVDAEVRIEQQVIALPH